MIDVGFNLLSWAVLKRKSLKYIDNALRSCTARRDPYEDMRIESPADPMDVKWMAIDLARGMQMKNDALFQPKSEAANLVSTIISKRGNKGLRIEGKIYIGDADTCWADLTISIMSKKRSLQMTVDCKVLDPIYPTREILEMGVRFNTGEEEICFDIDPADIDVELFLAAIKDKSDGKLLVRGCRIFAAGPDAWAAHLREVQGDEEDPWSELPQGNGSEEEYDLGFEDLDIPKFGPRTTYLSAFESEKYIITLYAGSRTYWSLMAIWAEKFVFSATWDYCDDYLLIKILQNDYRYFDWLREGMDIETLAGEEPPDKPIILKASGQPMEHNDANEEQAKKRAERRARKKRKKEALHGVEDLTSDSGVDRPVEHVHINDLIVRSKVRTCWDISHEIREVIAIICIFTPRDGVKEVAVDAFCCPQCRRYYILQKTFDRLQSKGALCCKVITRQSNQQGYQTHSVFDLSDKSLLKSLGYNANAKEDLSAEERRAVLDFVIENGFKTQKQTIGFIQHLIDYNGRAPNMEDAVKKWESDIEYLIKSKGKHTKRVKIDRIFLTEHKWR